MASITTNKTGVKRIQFTAGNGKRPSLHLGKVPLRTAEAIKRHVENLLHSQMAGIAPARETAVWIESIGDDLRRRLGGVGLIDTHESATLGAFIDAHIERRRSSLKPATLVRIKQARKHLCEYFTEDKTLSAITAADAEDYRAWLLDKAKGPGLAEATTRRNSGYARMWFGNAIKRGIITTNPFEAVPTHVMGNSDRQRFISDGDARKVLDQLPDASWRLLFVLARWGGVRTPSEPAAMTWADVDWDKRRLTVHSSKTAHHAGHEKRVIPLFPEIAEAMQEVFDAAPEGELYVLPFLQTRTGASLRKPLERAIEAAGLSVWPRLWHNLRASRQTELEERFPSHVVCAWLGNSVAIAQRHYLQVRDSDFERAIEKRVQNPAQQVHAGGSRKRKQVDGVDGENAVFPHNSAYFRDMPRNENESSGRYRTRTYDLTRVKGAL